MLRFLYWGCCLKISCCPLGAPSTGGNVTECLVIGHIPTGQVLGIGKRFLRSQDVCSKEHISVTVLEKHVSGIVLKELANFTVCPWNFELLELKLMELFIGV